jgi:hypothetical protein
MHLQTINECDRYNGRGGTGSLQQEEVSEKKEIRLVSVLEDDNRE